MAALCGLVAPRAVATNLGDLRAQAQAISARIAALGNQEGALSEHYDATVLALKQTQVGVARAKAQVVLADQNAGVAKAALLADATDAYLNSGSGSYDGSSAASSLGGANASLLRAEYEQSLARNQADTEKQYVLASNQAKDAETALQAQQSTEAADLTAIAGAEKQVQKAQVALQAVEAQVTGRIAAVIAAQQAAARLAAQRAAEARLAAARAAAARQAAARLAAAQAAAARAAAARVAAENAAAAARAAATTTTTIATTTTTPVTVPAGTVPTGTVPTGTVPTGTVPTGTVPTSAVPTTPTTEPSSSPTTFPPPTAPPNPVGVPDPIGAAAAAVAAAETRIGDPYVWGAVGPGTFDCSGLVMWAYDQAGISLPHYSGSQYADTAHIPMADLEPGDLVFFANPGEHVAMYIGNGEIVQAPYTGADVEIAPLISAFVLASRVT